MTNTSSRRPAGLWRARRPALLATLFGLAVAAPAAFSQTVPVDCSTRDKTIESCAVDASVETDWNALQVLLRNQLAPFAGEGTTLADVKITFSGRARVITTLQRTDEDKVDNVTTTKPPVRSDSWRMFNPASRNEFQLTSPASLRTRINEQMLQTGQTRPLRGRVGEGGGDSPDRTGQLAPGGAHTNAWSGGNDSRVRHTETTSWPWRTIGDMGGCTGTFIGPRHIVTAGHCIYSRTSFAWTSGFTLVPGRDANTKPYGQTTMPPVAGQTGWYFTPVGFRAASPSGGSSQYDFAIVVVPDRLGDTVGWMGYGTLNATTMRNSSHFLRGYPFCESETTGTGERIDEPVPCVINGFYAGDPCSVGEFSVTDGDNWNRRVTHGCDASAANSGSAIYSYQDGFGPFVSMIHTTSLKCAFPGDSACTAADLFPLQATRLTPEYTGWVSYFRNLFP